MRLFISLMSLSLLLFSVVASGASKLPAIAFAGGVYDRGTFSKEMIWQGLYCIKLECELRNADIQVKYGKEKDEVMDDWVSTEKIVDTYSFKGLRQVYFSGLNLPLGKVVTGYISTNENRYSSLAYTSLKRLDKWQLPWHGQKQSIIRYWVSEANQYKYYFTAGGKKQFLFAIEKEWFYGTDATPLIDWVGDLDGDGKIDFLIDMSNDNCGYEHRLYLSSLANDGGFVGKAAVLSGSSPACGC